MHPDCYIVTLPYPDTPPARQDLRLARQIFPLYTGSSGELASVADYVYAALRTADSHAELSGIFDTLAQTELTHFRLLGRLLRGLGADPIVRARIDSSRLSGELTAASALRSFFEQCLLREHTAADNYRYLMGQTGDEAVRTLLQRILQDEEAHIRLFETLLH